MSIGGFSPLTGFMEQSDYERVVADMRLANGLPWSIELRSRWNCDRFPLKEGWIRLDDPTGRFVGVLHLTQNITTTRL